VYSISNLLGSPGRALPSLRYPNTRAAKMFGVFQHRLLDGSGVAARSMTCSTPPLSHNRNPPPRPPAGARAVHPGRIRRAVCKSSLPRPPPLYITAIPNTTLSPCRVSTTVIARKAADHPARNYIPATIRPSRPVQWQSRHCFRQLAELLCLPDHTYDIRSPGRRHVFIVLVIGQQVNQATRLLVA